MVTESRKLSYTPYAGKSEGKRHHASPEPCRVHGNALRPGVCWTCDRLTEEAQRVAEPDRRPRCDMCSRRLGRTETSAGQCLPCRRIAEWRPSS